jgi:hypothetical protein
VVGSFTEASSFGAASLISFAFSVRLYLGQIYPRLTFSIAFLSLVSVILSTSSTAYSGLCIFLVVLYFSSFARLIREAVPISVIVFVVISPILGLAVLLAAALDPTVERYFDTNVSVGSPRDDGLRDAREGADTGSLDEELWSLSTALREIRETAHTGPGWEREAYRAALEIERRRRALRARRPFDPSLRHFGGRFDLVREVV